MIPKIIQRLGGAFFLCGLCLFTVAQAPQFTTVYGKPKMGVEYFMTYFGKNGHHVGAMVTYKKVDASAGIYLPLPQYPEFAYDVSKPLGGYFSFQFAGKNPQKKLRFSFNTIISHWRGRYKGFDSNIFTTPPSNVETTFANTMVLVGPGLVFRVVEGFMIRFNLLGNFYSKYNGKADVTFADGEMVTQNNSVTFAEFPLDDPRSVVFKIGFCYVFYYQ